MLQLRCTVLCDAPLAFRTSNGVRVTMRVYRMTSHYMLYVVPYHAIPCYVMLCHALYHHLYIYIYIYILMSVYHILGLDCTAIFFLNQSPYYTKI